MKVSTAFKNGTFIVRPIGEIDHHSASDIRKKIDEAIDCLKPERLVMDLSETGFMDSSGLGRILGRYRKSKEAGIEFSVLNPTESVIRILRFSGMEKMMDIQIV